MEKDSRIYVAGHCGLVGSALIRCLRARGFRCLITAPRSDLDLTEQGATDRFFSRARPDYVLLAAAKVGGIFANLRYPVEFLRDNLRIQLNVIENCARYGIKKLLFLGSSCIYPKFAPQPITEDALMTGPLEETNSAYAIAKIAGIRLCQAYRQECGLPSITLMPTNLYGPGDRFDTENSHVLPALIAKFHEAKLTRAKQVLLWGSGDPYREFLHVDDLAEAALFLMERYDSDAPINVGTGEEIRISELAALVARIVGWQGEIVQDQRKPDGTPRKLLDVSKLHALGWQHSIELEDGIHSTHEWYMRNLA